jgi:hypothetical protein
MKRCTAVAGNDLGIETGGCSGVFDDLGDGAATQAAAADSAPAVHFAEERAAPDGGGGEPSLQGGDRIEHIPSARDVLFHGLLVCPGARVIIRS